MTYTYLYSYNLISIERITACKYLVISKLNLHFNTYYLLVLTCGTNISLVESVYFGRRNMYYVVAYCKDFLGTSCTKRFGKNTRSKHIMKKRVLTQWTSALSRKNSFVCRLFSLPQTVTHSVILNRKPCILLQFLIP